MGRCGRQYFAPDGCRDGEVVGTDVCVYRPPGPSCPGVADSRNFGCAEATCVPVNTCCGAVVKDTGVPAEKPVLYQFAALVCRLVLVPQWGVDVEVAAG